jgi:hypothetical protein
MEQSKFTSNAQLRQITPKEFASLGLEDVAYIKPVSINDGKAFAIHTADGTPVAVVPDLAVAVATVRQHEMEPLSVH